MTELAAPILSGTAGVAAHLQARLVDTLMTPSATLSLVSLTTALLMSVLWVTRRRRPAPLRVLRRALLPRRWLFGASARIDWVFAAFNILLIGLLLGWAVLSAATIAEGLSGLLEAIFGAMPQPLLTGWSAALATTFILFLAFEAAYFLEHYLAHKIDFLWHFHRVHHLAETLGPATFHRVHPVDSIIFYNFIAVFSGLGTGLCAWMFGRTDIMTMWGENALLAIGAYLIVPLQHSHIWIPVTGWLGHIILSPAHHQLHHSDDPRHHNQNFGNILAVFDWLAGSLTVPDKQRPRLVFGAGDYPVNPHGLTGAFAYPFVEAWKSLRRKNVLSTAPSQTEVEVAKKPK